MPAPFNPSWLLWIVAVQMATYAVMWLIGMLFVPEARRASLHWAAFLVLLALGLLLAGGRDEQRLWWHYNAANVATLIGFALMRRGTQLFMGVGVSDREQLLFVLPVLLLVGVVLQPSVDHAPWRIVITYLAQAAILARTLWKIRHALALEYGRPIMLGLEIPGAAMVAIQVALALRQLAVWPQPTEMHLASPSSFGVMLTYLIGGSVFSFGFVTMVINRLVLRLHTASLEDPLTGVLNRRAVTRVLDRQWSLWKRAKSPFSVLVIDLDHFKRINDTRGHAGGDEVLVQVTKLLRKLLRTEDWLARAGGEEFWLVLPNTPLAQALGLAERLRAHVEDAALGTTLSIGVAESGATDSGPMQTIERADAAVYRAKAQGRNRVVAAAADAGTGAALQDAAAPA